MSRGQSTLSLTPEEITTILHRFPKGIVAVDVESTGLSPLVDKIIEIAAVRLNPDRSVQSFHSLVNPLIDIPEFTIQFHGLTNQDLQHAPTIKKPLREFWDFIGRLPLIGHNSIFDLGWLIKASHDFQIVFPPVDVFDSCRFSRAAWKGKSDGPQNFKLSTLCHYFGFDLNHHVAIEDTYAALKIFAGSLVAAENHDEALKKSFVFRTSSFDKDACFNFSTRLDPLKELVQKKELLTLDYRGGSANGRIRPVRPIGLMPLPQGPVLFAECLLTGMNKSFLLKKIKAFTKLEACLLARRS